MANENRYISKISLEGVACLLKDIEAREALENYKLENNPKVKENTEDIAEIFAKLDTVESNAQENKIEGISVNGVNLAISADKLIDIPTATAENFGVVKLGDEFQTDTGTHSLKIKQLNINKLVQTSGDILLLDGGLASNLK